MSVQNRKSRTGLKVVILLAVLVGGGLVGLALLRPEARVAAAVAGKAVNAVPGSVTVTAEYIMELKSEADGRMLAGLLLLGLGIGLGLEERVVVERVRGDELLQRHVGLELGIAALERQMLLDDGREKGLVFSHMISRSRPEGRSVSTQCSRNLRK